MKNSRDESLETLVLALQNIDFLFEVDCGTSNVDICSVLSQERRLIALCSEKLNDGKLKNSTSAKESYVVVRALNHWTYYPLHKKFLLYSDHQAHKNLNSQHKLNQLHMQIGVSLFNPFQ